jgi:hypothetical protein
LSVPAGAKTIPGKRMRPPRGIGRRLRLGAQPAQSIVSTNHKNYITLTNYQPLIVHRPYAKIHSHPRPFGGTACAVLYHGPALAPMIKVGMPVDVGIQATGHTVHGSVSRMSDKVDPATRTMHVEVDLDNADFHWKAGMYATATITLNAKSDALAAPVQAVDTGDKPNV